MSAAKNETGVAASLLRVPALSAALCLTACAPMPRMSANWYTVVDAEPVAKPGIGSATAGQAKDKNTAQTQDVSRLLLAILNQESVTVDVSDIVINPGWNKEGQSTQSWSFTGKAATPVAPGQMLLLEIHRSPPSDPVKEKPKPDTRTGDLRTWTCTIPTRVRMKVSFTRQGMLGNCDVQQTITLDLRSPMPSALPYDWQHCWEEASTAAASGSAIGASQPAVSAPADR
ncbi:hypothetical protein [Mitsuaria sp. 7]|uniref:hypothetical protein n=1 Tax=Mitsuaria sp. 7 TaxID=1658665 RepID=UPI0007DCE657|nr:hypothetical protein [Mitsuaria sp. 7]ANH68117.1 hypothetical protein ABE85_11980 [Mitsuaria sp. 7]